MDPRRLSAVALAFAATLVVGCVSMPTSKPAGVAKAPAPTGDVKQASAAQPAPNADDPLPPGLSPKFVAFITNQGLAAPTAKLGEASRLAAAWSNKIIYAPDPTHGGEPVPGLIARLYVFGPDQKFPLPPDGELIIGLWDNSPVANCGQPALMELWHIDRETAAKFRKTDFMGEGYSLFLPWSKYHVDLKQVNVRIRYNGADGRCLVASPETLTIDHSATLQRAAEKLGIAAKPNDLPPGVTGTGIK
ncbi:MAG TPA: hypothetical protein VKE40_15050 [Gemmataceae bacterium]|nr:hypothetical protein [Gemmataceae bacterium]